MMVLLRWIIFIFILAVVSACVFFGMRIHVEAIPPYFSSSEPPVIAELQLTNGNQIVVPLIEETPTKVLVSMDDAEISFSREEIASMQILSKETLATEAYQTAHSFLPQKDPIITFNEEDRLIDLEKTKKEQQKRKEMYRKMGEQRAREKEAEKTLERYLQHDARVKREVRQRQLAQQQ